MKRIDFSNRADLIRRVDKIIDYGVLLDVSHLAEEVGLEHPTFFTPAVWNSIEIRRDEKDARLAIRYQAQNLRQRIARRDVGCEVHGFVLHRYIAKIAFYVFPSRRFGYVVVLAEPEEEFDLRAPRTLAGGSLYTQ